MEELQIIVHNNSRVLTTAQLAASYGAEEKLVQQNFSNNKNRYKEGKHFFLLQGEELRAFKRDFENLGFAQNLNKLYLWTEKGAWLHAKSLNTDAAWDAYEKLVDEYYSIVEKLSAEQQLRKHLELSLMTSQRVDEIEEKVTHLTNTMRVDGVEQKQLQEVGNRKGLDVLGGKDAPAYKVLKAKVFSDLWGEFKRHFVIPRYSELPKAKISEGLNFINRWRPSTSLELEIEAINSQGRLF